MDRRLEALEKRITEMEHMLVTRLDAIEVQIAAIRQRLGMPETAQNMNQTLAEIEEQVRQGK